MGICVKKVNWFLGNLATAEKAAAVQCERLSAEFAARGNRELAMRYELFAEEEWQHFKSVSSLIEQRRFGEDSRIGNLLGLNGRFKDWSLAERLYCIHVVFEPSALSNLSGVSSSAVLHHLPPDWSIEIAKSFKAILSDEGTHIYYGMQTLRNHFLELTNLEKRRLEINEKGFVKLIKGTISSLFSDVSDGLVARKINADYERFFRRQRRVLFHA